MSNYLGFFVRDELGQVPNQNGTSWSTSPDIIFQGTQPAPNPAIFATPAGYATDYGANVVMGIPPNASPPNYVYLRALNTQPSAGPNTPFTGRVWFFFVESDLALWPQNWRTDQITVAGGNQNYQDIVATSVNQICQPLLPYIWTPPSLAAGTHFCAVSWIENTPVNPPQNPVIQIGAISTFDALVNLVLANPNMGWRNTIDVAGAGPTWSQTTNITGPATPSVFNLGIQCKNMPTDGIVSYTIPGPNPSIPPIILPSQQIPNPNWSSTVQISNWPANAQSSIVVNYTQGPTTPPSGANISVSLTVPTSTLSDKTFSLATRVRPELLTMLDVRRIDERGSPVIMISPTHVFQLGSQTFKFGSTS